MPRLLHIDSALNDDESRTRRLTQSFADAWRERGAEFEVVTRDLALNPPPHLTERAQHWPEPLRDNPLAAETIRVQDQLVAELLTADVLIIGAPMYNYNIPSTLKAWIDLVHVPGVTSPFDTDTQPLRGRPAVIVTSQGGPIEPIVEDFVTAPLKYLLGTGFGMDVHVVGTSLTLADKIPALGAQAAAAEFARATDEAQQLGRSLAR